MSGTFYTEDTICAPATSVGSGAISIIRISGPHALDYTDSLVSFRKGSASTTKGYELKYGTIDGLDEVMVSLFRGPRSYTGEDCVEIACHASEYIVSEILSRLTKLGARMALPGEFTRRAYLNGKMDLAQAEAVADIIAADSAAAHDLALSQLRGGYSEEFRQLRSQLLELTSLIELELDFSEEEVEFADRSRLDNLLDKALGKTEKLRDSYKVGNAIKSGVPVAIVGAPNAGKSTLLNALLGEDRAIVSDIPGTTRDTVEETMVINGVRYRFIDTAGIRETSETIEKLGIERSLSKMNSAAIVLVMLDLSDLEGSRLTLRKLGVQGVERDSFGERDNAEGSASRKIIYVINKCDLALERDPLSGTELASEAIRISALRGEGIDALKEAISRCGYGLGKGGAEGAVVTSARHHSALCAAADNLSRALSALRTGIPGDLLSQDLRAAISSLSEIIGDISTDEVLGEIFSRFCVGK